MSDEQSTDESADSQQESEQQSTDSDQPAAQSDEQPAEQNDQSAEQSDEQPTESDQPAEQSGEQPTESDQPAEQAEEPAAAADQATEPGEQFAESDHAAEQSGDATGGGGGGGGSGGGSGGGAPADDVVAADSGSGSKRPLRVIAEFTQGGGQKFNGEIMIEVSEYDDVKRKIGVSRFPPPGPGQWAPQKTSSKGNVIDTNPLPGGVPGVKVAVTAMANVLVDVGPSGEVFQSPSRTFVIPMPSGTDVLPVRFDAEVKDETKEIAALDAVAAETKFRESVKGHLVLTLNAQPIGKGQFRVTGKYLTGEIQSSTGEKFIP
jgi:hypothetical protein